MDLNTIEELVTGAGPQDWRPGDAWLAGGTWLFSEPQPTLRRLLDLTSLDWPPLELSEQGLTIASTCTIAELYGFEPPSRWPIGTLIRQCCNSFLASFKIWNEATVGGNLCNALPAGPMISLTAGLGGSCLILTPSGSSKRVPVAEFITGNNSHLLEPGELLRSITLPADNLSGRTAFRQASLTTLGRSAALLIGRLDPEGLTLTVTASTIRPLQLTFSGLPSTAELHAAIDVAIPDDLYHNDIHGLPTWRAHLTHRLAEEIRVELGHG
jgi:CO/xanthine dehydrogenase FAD-binding subunit